ncbi:MAG: family 16 glycosylhydrolase [Hyphomonadaceae bacterium]|nr:family 16 glycosylhydrolase [Hyphomonadaceae bacterium]
MRGGRGGKALFGWFLLVTCLATLPLKAQAQTATTSSLFVERFQTPLIDPRWIVSDGWHSGEWFSSEWRRDQVGLGPQGLVISLDRNAGDGEKPYVSGEISTSEEYLYGYFEARLRMPRGRGLVSAFFTFTRPEGVESWNEIDMELTGYDPRRIELVYHVAGQATLQVEELPFDASEDFHTYAFEWRRNAIRWYIDNELVHVSRRGRVAELTRPQRMFSSLWNSERMPRWLGVIDPSEAPWKMHVACMAYAPRYEGRSLCVD